MVKIARLMTQNKKVGRWLEFFDYMFTQVKSNGNSKDSELDEGKIQFRYMEYDAETRKAIPNSLHKYYVNTPVARMIFDDIINYRFLPDANNPGKFLPIWEGFGGGPGDKAGHPEWPLVSRQLRVSYDPAAQIGPAIIFNFSISEGEKTSTGGYKPKQGSQNIQHSMYMKLADLRPVALTVLDYIQSGLSTAMLIGRTGLNDTREQIAAQSESANNATAPQEKQPDQPTTAPAQPAWSSTDGLPPDDPEWDPFVDEG